MSRPNKKQKKPLHRSAIHTPLASHTRIGSVLATRLSPTNSKLPLQLTQWRDDHAPEMLWAFLLASSLDRDVYLELFRKLVIWSKDNLDSPATITQSDVAFSQPVAIPDLTRLSELSLSQLREFLEPVMSIPGGREAMTPMLSFDFVPGIDLWRAAVGRSEKPLDWYRVGKAVIPMLDQQSEISTDVRWLKLVVCIASGTLRFPESLRAHEEEILFYPNRGELRSVRPSIRAMEQNFRRPQPAKWISVFWDECHHETACVDPSSKDDYPRSEVETIELAKILAARFALIERFEAISTTHADPKLDGAVGIGLYALALLYEIAWCRSDGLITGKLILRALTETLITLRYLAQEQDSTRWEEWRRFGNGQSKLAFLRAESFAADVPSFIEQDILETMANEDRWLEFQDIETGHWQKSNLRKMAEKTGSKQIYDAYYQWSSAFVHGHWCATRDVNFITCHNPLHRLHRIPRTVHRGAKSCLNDAITLTNLVIAEVETVLSLKNGEIPRVSADK